MINIDYAAYRVFANCGSATIFYYIHLIYSHCYIIFDVIIDVTLVFDYWIMVKVAYTFSEYSNDWWTDNVIDNVFENVIVTVKWH